MTTTPPQENKASPDNSGARGHTAKVWQLLMTATDRVPGGIWVFGPVALGLGSCVVISAFLGSARLAFFGTFSSLIFAVAFYAFAKGTAHVKRMIAPLLVMVWAVVVVFFVALPIVIFSCVFWGRPLDLRQWLVGSNSRGSYRDMSDPPVRDHASFPETTARQVQVPQPSTEVSISSSSSPINSKQLTGSINTVKTVAASQFTRCFKDEPLDGVIKQQRIWCICSDGHHVERTISVSDNPSSREDEDAASVAIRLLQSACQ